MSLMSVPVYGKPTTFTEDIFSKSEQYKNPITYDDRSPSYPCEVVIGCPNKDVRIQAPLAGGLKLSSQSEWTEMFGGGIGSVAGGIIGTFDNMLQWSKGTTIQQPWMNRKIYKNTKPFSFSFPLTLITPIGGNCIDYVAKPTIALLSLLYPRQLNEKGLGDSLGLNGDSVVGAFTNLLNAYAIPGPGLKVTSSGAKQDEKGDYIYILAGNMFNFGMCYLDSVDVEFSETFDQQGIPLAAKVNLKATCQDSVYCDKDGNFNLIQLKNSAENLDKCLDTLEETKQQTLKTLKDMVGFFNPKE